MLNNVTIKSGFFCFVDVRGFTKWASTNQFEIADLLDIIYESAFEAFGRKKEQQLLNRVVKFLGDGFYAVREYDEESNESFENAFIAITDSINLFYYLTNGRLKNSKIHGKKELGLGFGLSYGKASRFNLVGEAIDYVGERINFASRLCDVACDGEVIIETDLQDTISKIKNLKLYDPIIDKRPLKKMEDTPVIVMSFIPF